MPADDKARLGARLRRERKDRGLVVEDLAEEFRKVAPERIRQRLPRLRDLQRMIRGWEAGEHNPGEQYRLLYCRAFDMDEQDLFAGDPATQDLSPSSSDDPHLGDPAPLDLMALAWTMGRLDQRMDRRAILQLAAALAATPALGVADPIDRITHALNRPSGLNEDMVNHLEARSIGFHRLEFVLPAHQIFRAILAHLSGITSLLEICTQDRLRKRLARTAGEAAVLGAWVAWDLDDFARATALYRVAELAAKEADDQAIVACSVIYQSFGARGAGAHIEARQKLAAAQHLLPKRGDLATRAWLMGREAEEAAASGDSSAKDMIEVATDMLADARPHSERSWTRCLESPRLDHMRMTIATHLRDEATVYENANELALLADDPAQKKTGRILASIGLALVSLGDVSEGIEFGARSLEAIRHSQAKYAMNRLSELDIALEPQGSIRSRELREGIHATRRELLSPHPST
ncbi:XRE family transcriptional regulator [Actinomadura alba]|uniref:XRE family transcriptional regulator n=1 Tax=Actinomadura alba TaxID=406431 RepID=A0ABR7LQ99_9ACTN|nr:XRE family transcriptional regulator [Actinomadura alba]MBC6466660.1 XRE family transcriptional regulator [Actinomadura alba]